MRVYWQFIQGMLTNVLTHLLQPPIGEDPLVCERTDRSPFCLLRPKQFGSMPLDRIQSMLGFAPDYNRTLEQLGEFMEALRREGVVDRVASGEWVLR